jgi:hypothetical protein
MENLGSQGADFHEVRYLNIFQKSVKKIQVSLKTDNNNRCFTRRPMYFFIISDFRIKNVPDFMLSGK